MIYFVNCLIHFKKNWPTHCQNTDLMWTCIATENCDALSVGGYFYAIQSCVLKLKLKRENRQVPWYVFIPLISSITILPSVLIDMAWNMFDMAGSTIPQSYYQFLLNVHHMFYTNKFIFTALPWVIKICVCGKLAHFYGKFFKNVYSMSLCVLACVWELSQVSRIQR